MNFNIARTFYLLISFVIGAFFFILGLFSLILPWSSFLQTLTTSFILKNTLIFFLFGLGFVLIGLSIIIYTYINTRHRYLHIQIGNNTVTLDENLVHQYLERYWKEHFPNSHVPFEITFKKNALEIVADLPSLALEDQKTFLERVKNDFSDMFGRILGYPHDVHLIASFQNES